MLTEAQCRARAAPALPERQTIDRPGVCDPPAGVKYHHDIVQGSDEWLAARCGLLTASEMKLIVTPTQGREQR